MLVNIRIYITCAIFLRLVKLSKTEILDAILIDRKFKAAFLGDFITVYLKKKRIHFLNVRLFMKKSFRFSIIVKVYYEQNF